MHLPSKSALSAFHSALHRWYAVHGRRDLPWRNTDDAYAIYISEVMLQQTQVQTVLARFYHPFLHRFPTLQALADAPREAVMKQWEGLGYYSRAANLHKAAQLTAPELPRDVGALVALPGIGRNTAHAVAAFAYHQPVPVMEANVKRVLCRVFALETPSPEALWEHAFHLLDSDQPFDYNQAMMDIGAMVCTRCAPSCDDCPLSSICAGKTEPQRYPAAKAKKVTPIRKFRIIVWSDAASARIYLTPRDTAFLGGLYGFAEYPAEAETVSFMNRAYDLQEAGLLLGEVSQTYSHFRAEAEVWRVEVDSEGENEGWHSISQIHTLALSGIDHKIVKLVSGYIGKMQIR